MFGTDLHNVLGMWKPSPETIVFTQLFALLITEPHQKSPDARRGE